MWQTASKVSGRMKVRMPTGMAARYRVLYAFNPRPHREIAYDQDHPRIQRIIAAYDRLDLA